MLARESELLGRLSFQLPLAGSLDLGTFGIHFLLESLLTLLLSLGLVDLCHVSAECREKERDRQKTHTCSTRARLCLKVLPLDDWYSSWYRCLSILPAARYLTRSRRSTLSRRIQRTWLYIYQSVDRPARIFTTRFHTWAFWRPWYPSSYQSLCVDQFFVPHSVVWLEIGSAWQRVFG